MAKEIKNAYSKIPENVFNRARRETNPYERLGSGQFMNRAALKMANVDALYKLTGHYTGLMDEKIRDNTFTYVGLCEGPGGFIEYLQYRSPEARGHGISLMGDQGTFKWNYDKLDMIKLDLDYKGRVRGNILLEWRDFCDYVLVSTGQVSLVTGDGGVGIKDDAQYEMEEQLNAPVIFTEVLMALILLRGKETPELKTLSVPPPLPKRGGSFFLKIYDAASGLMGDLIYVLTRCFSKVSIIKPVTSRPANSERYLVCQDRHSNPVVDKWISLLEKVQERVIYDDSISCFLDKSNMDDYTVYVDWLRDINNLHMQTMNEAGLKILKYVSGDSYTSEKVDLIKCYTLWNLSQTKSKSKQDVCTKPSTRGHSRLRK